jgi:hypothetical protein
MAELAAVAFQRLRRQHIVSPISEMLQSYCLMEEGEPGDELAPVDTVGFFPVPLGTATTLAPASFGCFPLPALISCFLRL